MKIDLIASMRHYKDHMLPIFEALPERLRGHIHPVGEQVRRPLFNHIAMVAGWQDVEQLGHRAKMIYVEHGAGQAYLGDEKMATLPGYSGGGARHRNVIGYVCPSATVAARWNAPAVAVGCPKMDPWLNGNINIGTPMGRSVCIAFHWDCRLGPEMRTAFWHYRSDLYRLADQWRAQGFHVYGHGHPRWGDTLGWEFAKNGIEVLPTDTHVFMNADVLVMDNSSLMYEFASMGRPVIALNAPWYRRDVEHGMRFWSQVPGLQVDGPEQLLELDLLSHVTTDPYREYRQAVVDEVYAFTDGTSAERAAAWITQLVDAR